MSGLLPCPFCGSSLIATAKHGSAWHFATCTQCIGVRGPSSTDRETALRAWNRRSPPAPAIDVEQVVRAVLDAYEMGPSFTGDALRAALGGKEQP